MNSDDFYWTIIMKGSINFVYDGRSVN